MAKKSYILAVILLVLLAGTVTVVSAATDATNDRVIVTYGSGTVIVSPDRAEVSLGVQTQSNDAKTAQQMNAAQMNTCINALMAAGFTKDQLQTSGYSITPIYDDSSSAFSSKVKTYQVTNTLTVKINDINQTGSVVDIAVANGANEVNSIQFLLSEEQSKTARTVALQKAVAQTRSDADTVAQSLGVQVTQVQSVDVNQGYTPVAYKSLAMDSYAAGRTSTTINPSDLSVTASVTVTYAIR